MDMPFAPTQSDDAGQTFANRQILIRLLRRLRDGQPKFHQLADHSRRIAFAINQLAEQFSPALQEETERLLTEQAAKKGDEAAFEACLNRLFDAKRLSAIMSASRRIAVESLAIEDFLARHAEAMQSDHAALKMALAFTAGSAHCGFEAESDERADVVQDIEKLTHTLSISLRRLTPLARASIALRRFASDFAAAAMRMNRVIGPASAGRLTIESVLCLLVNVQHIIMRAEELFTENAAGFTKTRLPVTALNLPSASSIIADPSVMDRLMREDVPLDAVRH